MKNKFVAIGDIHGCFESLKAIWQKLEPYRDSLHIFIGDYIDRGPKSREVVDFLLKEKENRNCIFLRGNHEQMLLDAVHKGQTHNWMYNGGRSTLESYGIEKDINKIPETHIQFYEDTKLFHDTDDYFFVHAGVPPHQTIAESKEDPRSKHFFLWGREHLNAFDTPWEKTVVFGHTPRAFPIRKKNMLGIDTGCVYDAVGYGKLTAVVLPDMKFIEQKSLDLE